MIDEPSPPKPKKKRPKGPYAKHWRKGVGPLPPGIWPDTTVTSPEAARILGVDIRSLERQRANGNGPVQVPSGAFYGRTIRYVAWQLIAWRNKVIGSGPIDRHGVWEWWMETCADFAGPRPEPPRKPPGTPKREQRRETNRRLRRNLILRWAEAEDQHAQRLFERVTIRAQ